jgi:hypothetical protein
MGADDHEHDQPRRKDRKKYSCAGESGLLARSGGCECERERKAVVIEMQKYRPGLFGRGLLGRKTEEIGRT